MERLSVYAIPGIRHRLRKPDDALMEAAKLYGLKPQQLLDKTRKQPIAESRFYAMWLMRTEMGMTYHQIGSYFMKDHAAVVHAVKVITLRKKMKQLLITLSVFLMLIIS